MLNIIRIETLGHKKWRSNSSSAMDVEEGQKLSAVKPEPTYPFISKPRFEGSIFQMNSMQYPSETHNFSQASEDFEYYPGLNEYQSDDPTAMPENSFQHERGPNFQPMQMPITQSPEQYNQPYAKSSATSDGQYEYAQYPFQPESSDYNGYPNFPPPPGAYNTPRAQYEASIVSERPHGPGYNIPRPQYEPSVISDRPSGPGYNMPRAQYEPSVISDKESKLNIPQIANKKSNLGRFSILSGKSVATERYCCGLFKSQTKCFGVCIPIGIILVSLFCILILIRRGLLLSLA